MSAKIRRRANVAAAVMVAGGTLLAAVGAATPASAATLTPAFYSGATEGDVVQVALNLPSALPALPGLPKSISLGLISAKGSAVHDALSAHPVDQSSSFAGLGSGTLVTAGPLGFLGRNVEATLARPLANDSLATIPANPLITSGAGGAAVLGGLHAAVQSVSDGNLSTANLVNVNIGNVGALLGGPNSTVFQTLQSVLNQTGIVSQVQNTINTVVTNLNPLAKNDPTGAVTALQTTLTQLQSELNNIISKIQNTALIKLDTLDATQGITPLARGAQSQAHVKLVSVDILSGLVHVDGFTSDATAFADGIAGDARATYNPVVAHASIGNGLLAATLGQNGLNITAPGVPASVTQQVNQALKSVQDALNSLLATIGLSVSPAAGHSYASPDGTFATATGGALTIALRNLAAPTAAPLARVVLGGTTAQARAEQAPAAPAHVKATHLAFTGANLPLTGGLAVLFLGGAMLLRRRSASNS